MQDNNPYLNFLDEQEKKSPSTSPAGVANPYLSMLDQQERSEEIRRRSTLGGAIGGDADAEARARKLAQDLNLPPGAVRGMGLDQAQRQQQLQQIDQNTQQTPTLKRRYTSADFAAIAHDDSQNLGPLERLLTEIGGRGFAKDAALSKISELGAKTTFGQSLTPYEEIELQDAKKRLERLAREQEGRGDLSYVMNVGTAAVSQFVRGVPTGLVGAAGGAAVAAPVAAGGALLAGQFGPQVAAPEEIVTVPVAAIGGALWGGRMGFAAGTLYYNYQQIVGSSYELEYSQYRDENGKPLAPEIAIGAAHLNAMLGVGLETVADLTLAKTVPGLEKFLSAPGKDVVNKLLASETGRNALIRIGKKIGTASGIEGLTEAAQQAIQILVGEGAKLVDQGEFAPITLPEAGQQIATAAIEGAIGGGFIAGATAPVQVVIENRELKKAEIEGRTSVREINRLEAAIDAAGKTKLIERDRGELERFVDEAAADSPVSTIYLSAEDLASVATTAGLEPRQLAQQLGVADQIQTSTTTGSLLEMPIGRFIATVAGTDFAKPLLEIVKTNPFLLNRTEIKQLQEIGRADVIAEADRLVQEALTDETFAAEAQSIQDEVLQQFRSIEGGEVFTPEVSRAYTTITTQTYVSLARRLGISPREAYERYQRGPLKIERQAGPVEGVGQPVMEQAQTEGYTGQDIGEAQEWVRARAKGLDMSQPARMARAKEMGFDTDVVYYHGTNANLEQFDPSTQTPGAEGFYFTTDPAEASLYARKRGKGLDDNVVPVYLRNPVRENANVVTVSDPSNIRSVNAAFDPDFAESANVLAQEGLPTLEADPAAFGLTPEQAKKVNPIYNPKTLPVKRLPSNQEAALWLEANYIGTPIKDLTVELSDKQINEIATIMAAEAQLALGNTGNAFTWYSSALARALDIISIKYPMLADDASAAEAGFGTSRNARFIFTYIMAVTSQNLDVSANSVATDKAFGEMLELVRAGDFTMPRSWGTGDKQKAMGENFAKFGPLIEAMGKSDNLDFPGRIELLDELFREKKTVKEWVSYMEEEGIPYNPPGQTAMDAVVYGSSLLGPKIGNGFWQNLNGNYDPLTIDLWMRRTWGRLTGKSIGNPAALPEQRSRLKAAIERSRSRDYGNADIIAQIETSIAAAQRTLERLDILPIPRGKAKARKDEVATVKAEIETLQEALVDFRTLRAPEAWKAEYNKDDKALLDYSKRVLKAWDKEYKRLRKEHGKSVPADLQPTWARAAKTIITNLAKPLDQVANGTQRKQIERAGKEALRILQERGITLTTADLQAILWYPEKELWGSLTTELATDEDGVPVVPPSSLNESYDTAFSRILKEQGYEVQGTAGDGGGGPGAGTVAGQDGGPQQPESAGGLGALGDAVAGGAPDSLGQSQRNRGRPEPARDGGRRFSSGGLAPLEGAPVVQGATGPDPAIVAVAEQYAADNGIDLRRQARYAKVDPDFAARIAAAYEAMPHAPDDPAVRAAYEDLTRQTRAQYDALVAAGYAFTFYDEDTDPYAGNPSAAMRDLRANKRMAVFGTYAGFGTEGVEGNVVETNIMRGDTGLQWPDQNGVMHMVTPNDLFRAVHDAFGHSLEGAGFRARGEENAWQAHVRLYTGPAVGAITSETRGQNSWLNFGPYGEENATANVQTTVFAPNKTGLMPEWTWTEGVVEDMPEEPQSYGQSKRNLDALGFYSAVQEAALRVPDGIWQLGWNAARNAIAKGRGGVPPRRTEIEYLGLDAMFGDAEMKPGDNFPRKGAALKEAVLEHIAAKRLSLVEIFTRFDPNVKAPTKAQILDEIDDDTLGFMMGVAEFSMGFEEGRIVASELDGADEFHTGLFVRANKQEVSDDPVKRYDMPRRTYNLYRGLNLPGKRELVATGVIGDLLGKAARIILNENRNLVMRKISAADMRDYWEQSRTTESAGLVRGPGDIRLPGEDVPLFEAVIGLPKGVPGADYQAPISHVGGKAKGTLVTAHGEERVDDKGQRTIFVGQVQSDMAQQARELKAWQDEQKRSLELIIQRSGIVDRETAAAYMKADGATDAGIAEFNDADLIGFARQRWAVMSGGYQYNYGNLRRLENNPSQTLDAPLLSTSEWTNVAVRAMIYRAARGGFQSISFPTGETSAIIQGNDYAAQHYETNVKGALEKIGKQLGGEVRKSELRYQDDAWAVFEDGTPFSDVFNDIESAEYVATQRRQKDSKANVEVRNLGMASAYILDITPEMREKILSEGFPLFQERRGEYVPNLNTIRMLPKADWSSYLHEMGHHFLEVYNNAALQIEKIPEADRTPDEQKIVDDMRVLLTDMARQADVQIIGDVLQWWANTPLAGRTPVHEKYAEATEKYFMEGKAPVPELQALFDRFKTWLLDVYKNLTALKVELTPEVRGVMDRMYAAHETVRTAEYNRKLVALFREKPEAMTDQEWTAYQQIAAQATSDAQDDLTARSLRDMQWLSGARARVLRDMQRDNADKRKLVRAEVAAEVMARPVNVARSFLRRGIAPNGEPVTGAHKLNIDLLKARYPDISGVDWKRLGYGQYGMLAKDGIDPDMAAEMLGYPSGDALVTSLLSAVPAEPEIDTETDRRMLERFGDLTDEVKMSKAADDVIHSAMRAKVLQAEYAALIKASKQTKPLVIAAKEIAREIVGRQLASKLNLNKYLAAERAAGRKAEAAMRSGDFAAAASAKRDQLLNFEVVREAQRVLKERDKALDLFSRINKAKRETVAKTRNYDLVQAARAVLAAYGFGSMKNQPIDYMAAVKAYDPALYSALEPTILAAVTAGKTLDQLTVTEFMGLRDTVRQFWDLSRQEMKVDIEGRQLDLEDIVQDLNGQLEAQGAAPKGPSTEAPTEWQQRLRQFAGLKASMRRVETWARLFDRGKVGAFTRFIWRPVSEAADRYRTDRNTYILRFRELFRAIEPTMGGGKINAPEINYTFKNKSELLHAILHTGNGSNYRKLLLGRGWGTEDQDGNLIDNAWQNLINRLSQEGVINKADFDFAQSVWDLLEEIKPLAQATHKKVFGSYFAEITAEAVQTPFGTYKGGYVPAVYDTYNVQDAALRAQQEAVEANDSTMFPSPASGFTKSRVEYNRELALDLMIMSSHIDKVLKFAHLASPVRDVLKILRNKSFSAMLESVDPTAQSDMLLPWLTRAARQITEEPTKGQGGPMVDGFFRAIRQRSGMGLMFANVVNVAQQVTGFSVAALTVKPKYLASGLIRYTRNPMAITKAIRQASPMMADRGDNQLASMYGAIDKIIDKNDKYGQARDWFGRHTYFMQQGVQNVMDVIVWAGAYDQALAGGSTETEAARQGDAAVRQTQGSTFAEDVSRIETGTPMLRSFVHMYGYFNMWGNLLSTEMRTAVSELGLKKGAGRLMFVYIAGFAIPALLAQMIADGLRGQLPEDEDDDGWLDEWMSWFFGTQAKTATAFAPIVGQAINAIGGAYTSVPYDDRIAGSPAISAIEGAMRTISGKTVYDAIAEDGDKSKAIKDVLSLMTLATGIPFQALSRPVGYAVDVAEGDIEPTSELDYIRGLVTGTASEASRQ